MIYINPIKYNNKSNVYKIRIKNNRNIFKVYALYLGNKDN